MSRLAYVDAVAGLAGDMLLGALLDAGADAHAVADGLRTLGVDGLELGTERTARHGIAALAVRVAQPARAPAVHRSWREVRALIDGCELPGRARERAQAIFAALAVAEARVHGVEPEAVRFHEVGAIDAIGDVCGIALALESLAIDELACSPLPVPRGLIESAHGRLPLPAPATLELLRGAPLHGVELDVELVTPTGAAVVAALAGAFGPLPPMRLHAVGYGAGTRELAERPNVTRVLIGERELAADDIGAERGEALLIETNLDDLAPELVPDAAERCFAAGALDVWVAPVQMKKGRPGIVLSALARPADERAVAHAILRETTALGVRVSPVRRWELERRTVTVDVEGEPVRLKLGLLAGEPVNAAPEHDDCVAVARRSGRAVKDVWAAALAALARERVP
jgi:pyridinium-3,5-bisthiocarboxylic acid mononucleotide nickel chelatase